MEEKQEAAEKKKEEDAAASEAAGGVIEYDVPSVALARWLYAALARLDRDVMDADTCATVRAIYLASTTLRAQLTSQMSTAELLQRRSNDEGWRQRVAALNVILTLTGGYFQQAPREEWLGV